MKRVLTIAGSDCSGGAGIQADLKTIGALGAHGMSVVTAITAQNTCGVTGIWPVATKAVHKQLQTIFEDGLPDAIKIGMVYSMAVWKLLLELLPKEIPLVIDPVTFAKCGARLRQKGTLFFELLKKATLVTPNRDDAKELTGKEGILAAEALLRQGVKAILLKGEGTDLLVTPEQQEVFKGKKIETRNLHGSGCTLSAALAVFLAQGLSLEKAIEAARSYHRSALKEGRERYFGKGIGPLWHFTKEKRWRYS